MENNIKNQCIHFQEYIEILETLVPSLPFPHEQFTLCNNNTHIQIAHTAKKPNFTVQDMLDEIEQKSLRQHNDCSCSMHPFLRNMTKYDLVNFFDGYLVYSHIFVFGKKQEDLDDYFDMLNKPLLKTSHSQYCYKIKNIIDRANYNVRQVYLDTKEFLSKEEIDSFQDIYYSQMPQSKIYKKIVQKATQKSKAEFPRIALSLHEWALFLTEHMKATKANIVSREFLREPTEDRADRGTCSFCQRTIAVLPGGKGMAHHGYTRTGQGWQTGGCGGVDYPPLENSLVGLRAYLRLLVLSLRPLRKDKLLDVELPVIQTEKEKKENIRRFSRDSNIRFLTKNIKNTIKSYKKWEQKHKNKEVENIIPIQYKNRPKLT